MNNENRLEKLFVKDINNKSLVKLKMFIIVNLYVRNDQLMTFQF